MDKSEELFNDISSSLTIKYENVNPGKMMSAPGIKYKNKVFAFYYKEKMVFKLGKDYDLSKHNIDNFSLLNPFKNKPPLKAWFEISYEYKDCWQELAQIALNNLKTELD